VCSPHQHVQTATFAFERFGRAQLQNDKAILVGFLAEMARPQIVHDPFRSVSFLSCTREAAPYIQAFSPALHFFSSPFYPHSSVPDSDCCFGFTAVRRENKIKKKGEKLATIKN
jgi:hypothetical protein